MTNRRRVRVIVHGEYVVSLFGIEGEDGVTKRSARGAVMDLLGLKNRSEVSINAGTPEQDKVNEGNEVIIVRIDDTPVV